MPDSIAIQPSGPIVGRIRPPGSKSITNRALVCAALAEGPSQLRGALDSDDTRVMIAALRQLEIVIEQDGHSDLLTVGGCNGQLAGGNVHLDVGNSGTTIRFLTALATLGQGHYRLDGVARMRQRPIGDLLAALRRLGAEATSESPGECPPVVVHGNRLPGGSAKISGNISSQYLSGLLMAAPYAASDIRLSVEGTLVSQPYVRMTIAVMCSFGVNVKTADDLSSFSIRTGQRYQATDYRIEPDASAASYFFAAAAITGGNVTVEGLSADSLQGDVKFVDCLKRMGCEVEYRANEIQVIGRPLQGIDVNMNAISDTAQTLAVVALFAKEPTRITGIAHNRHKETDRISDLVCELRKLGAGVEEFDDGLCVTPAPLKPTEIDTYDDHRMAMSFALAGLKTPGVVINDPGCTAKTYPRFFDDLATIRAGQ